MYRYIRRPLIKRKIYPTGVISNTMDIHQKSSPPPLKPVQSMYLCFACSRKEKTDFEKKWKTTPFYSHFHFSVAQQQKETHLCLDCEWTEMNECKKQHCGTCACKPHERPARANPFCGLKTPHLSNDAPRKGGKPFKIEIGMSIKDIRLNNAFGNLEFKSLKLELLYKRGEIRKFFILGCPECNSGFDFWGKFDGGVVHSFVLDEGVTNHE